LPFDCDECRRSSETCERPQGLDHNGETNKAYGSSIIEWPRCPAHYMYARRWGMDALPLSDIVAQVYDRGDHRAPNAPAGLCRIVFEWLRCRELPQTLFANRAAKRAKT